MKNGETYWGSVEAVLTIDFFSCKICVVALGLHMYDIASAQATCVHSTQQPCGTWQVLWVLYGHSHCMAGIGSP